MQATFTKLRSGDWGIRVEGSPPAQGASISVAKRDGSRDVVVVDRVLWSGDGIALCAIQRRGRAARRPRSWRPCGYPGCSPSYCDECDGEGAGAGEW